MASISHCKWSATCHMPLSTLPPALLPAPALPSTGISVSRLACCIKEQSKVFQMIRTWYFYAKYLPFSSSFFVISLSLSLFSFCFCFLIVFFFVFSCNEIFLCRLSFSHSLIIVVVVTILTPFIYLCKFTNNYVLSPATGSRKKSLYNLHLSAAVRKWTAYNLHNKQIPRFGIPHNNRVEFLPDLEVLKGICMDKRSKSHLN